MPSWNILDDTVPWGNISNIPSSFSDGNIDWTEVINNPIDIFNWNIPVPLSFTANIYTDLGLFPSTAIKDSEPTSSYIFLIQFNIRFSAVWYHTITGAGVLSNTYWVPSSSHITEKIVECEHHNDIPTTLTYFFNTGAGYRNMLVKLNKTISVPSDGKFNIKIARII